MAEPTGVHIVEIRAGQSQRPVLELRPGVVVQPMSIGRVGMWSIDAPGLLDVHAYVYFDGRALFVQSADPSNPAKGNGQAIGTQWQQLEIPCTLELGRARLVYRSLDAVDEDSEEDKTIAQPIQIPRQPPAPPAPPAPPQFTPNAGAFSNRNNGPDSDATRLQPMTREPDPTVVSPLEAGTGMGAPTPMAGVPKARPAAGMPAWSTDSSPNSQPTQIGVPPQAPAPPPPQNTGYQAFGSVQVAVQPPPAAPMGMPMGGAGPMGQTLNSPMQSPVQAPPQMMMQMGYPQPGMMQYPQAPNTGPLPPGASGPMAIGPNAETGRVVPPGELTGWAKAVAEWKAMPPLRKLILGTFPGVVILVYMMMFDNPPPRHPRPMPSASAAASASASAAPSASTAATTDTTATPSATGSVPVLVASALPSATATATSKPPPPDKHHKKGAKTPEREAMELVGQGQNAKAAAIYDQLAKDHPEQPAYREAARLLRQRSN